MSDPSEKPNYKELLSKEVYAEEEAPGLEHMEFNEETGEFEYPNEDTFRHDVLQEKFLEDDQAS